MTYKEYEQFVINYKPFEWEMKDYDFRKTMKSKHSFIISYIRFYKVNNYLDFLLNEKKLTNPRIVDVGAFPGNMVFLSKKIFNNISKYYSVGLDLDQKFIEKMKELNVSCINTEIDPNFPEPKEIDDLILNRKFVYSLEEWSKIRKDTIGY